MDEHGSFMAYSPFQLLIFHHIIGFYCIGLAWTQVFNPFLEPIDPEISRFHSKTLRRMPRGQSMRSNCALSFEDELAKMAIEMVRYGAVFPPKKIVDLKR